ncbi:MAG: hypothetical protein AAFQ82_24445, partial [Myxococcota bacterium]
ELSNEDAELLFDELNDVVGDSAALHPLYAQFTRHLSRNGGLSGPGANRLLESLATRALELIPWSRDTYPVVQVLAKSTERPYGDVLAEHWRLSSDTQRTAARGASVISELTRAYQAGELAIDEAVSLLGAVADTVSYVFPLQGRPNSGEFRALYQLSLYGDSVHREELMLRAQRYPGSALRDLQELLTFAPENPDHPFAPVGEQAITRAKEIRASLAESVAGYSRFREALFRSMFTADSSNENPVTPGEEELIVRLFSDELVAVEDPLEFVQRAQHLRSSLRDYPTPERSPYQALANRAYARAVSDVDIHSLELPASNEEWGARRAVLNAAEGLFADDQDGLTDQERSRIADWLATQSEQAGAQVYPDAFGAFSDSELRAHAAGMAIERSELSALRLDAMVRWLSIHSGDSLAQQTVDAVETRFSSGALNQSRSRLFLDGAKVLVAEGTPGSTVQPGASY